MVTIGNIYNPPNTLPLIVLDFPVIIRYNSPCSKGNIVIEVGKTKVRLKPDYWGFHTQYPLEAEGGVVIDAWFDEELDPWMRIQLDDSSFSIPVKYNEVEVING